MEEYLFYLKKAWDSKWLTNNGPLLLELEKRIKNYLNVKHCFVCGNGTIALQIAIKALDIKGDIITTPYSYVATLNSILWEQCRPIFVDIGKKDFNIDAGLIRSAITKETKAILAVHVYGHPANVDLLAEIADENDLKIIYDGAHAFGSFYKNRSLLSFGDIATCSLHATKLMHAGEGGLIITNNDSLAEKIYLLRQFGHEGDNYLGLGINGKNSELHAALGLCVFDHLEEILAERKKTSLLYSEQLDLQRIQIPIPISGTQPNHAYFPVVFDSERTLLKVKQELLKNGINGRRYFYPSLNLLPHAMNYSCCEISESVAQRVLSLPLYVGLESKFVEQISKIINAVVRT